VAAKVAFCARGNWYAAILALLIVALGGWAHLHPDKRLVVAPMMELTPCFLAHREDLATMHPDWKTLCTGADSTASHLVESTLGHLQPIASNSSSWQLGYTLKVPLLAMLQQANDGWAVNQQALNTIVRTIRDSARPVVLYLFSTHFGVEAPIEVALYRDPDNLAQTPKGPLPVDTYYGQPIYPWSVARTDNAITHYREEVIRALIQGLCKLPDDKRSQIKGITLLGEVHQLFPNFQTGMGFDGAYLVSDYSGVSVTGFRQFLQERYDHIGALNQHIGSDYRSFDVIEPPHKDIRREPLKRFQEHLDPYASGVIPVSGWVHAPGSLEDVQSVQVFLDGRFIGKTPIGLSRQDVLAAHPEFGSANLGWRYDLDYKTLPTGIHRIDLALAQTGEPLRLLGTRLISIMDRNQTAPITTAMAALPIMQALPPDVFFSTDTPRNQEDFYFNPLASEWQAFRETQVLRYLKHFNNLVSQSCLSETPRYTHQIVPQFNPSWDSGKYAANASLQAIDGLHTGISLYGEASYGQSAGNWLKESKRTDYGVTEFHPLRTMDPQQLKVALRHHHESGARFLSFFLETRWQGKRVPPLINPFSFDQDNPLHASDALYNSMKAVLLE